MNHHIEPPRLPLFSFICCVWNEIDRAPAQLHKLINFLENLDSKIHYEIVIIDNFSTDGTREWIESINYPGITIVKILNQRNIGKGGSIRKAIMECNGVIGAIYDLDGEYIPDDAVKGCHNILDTHSTVLLASRTLDGSADYVYFQNYIGVRLLSEYINALYNVRLTDTATGLKIINIHFFKTHPPKFHGFNVDFELICIALNQSQEVLEYSGAYFPRSREQGKKIRAIKDGYESAIAITKTAFFSKRRVFPILRNILCYLFGRSAFRYFLVGFVASLIDIFVFTTLYSSLGFGILFSNTAAFFLALLANYLLGINLVFVKNARFSTIPEIILVALTSFLTLGLNTLVIYVIISCGLPALAAKLIALLPTFTSNYILRRFYIYKPVHTDLRK